MKASMPRKMLSSASVPTLVSERLAIWGHAIRTQRVRQRITADQLCVRIGLSRATLSRIERGDAAVNVAGYMGAFLVLGILDEVMPPLPPSLWSPNENGRVKARREEGDDDYF
jgi:transcriptional regulator with XRE-family HTH domain